MTLDNIKRERTRLTRERDSAQRVLDSYNKMLLELQGRCRHPTECWVAWVCACGKNMKGERT